MNMSIVIGLGPAKGMPLPLHPGAAKYYKEAGLTIPDRLMAK